MKKTTRRELIASSLFGATAVAASTLIACTKNKESDTATKVDSPKNEEPKELEFVSESENMAKTLNYSADASDVAAELRIDKGNVKGTDQFCTNCQFYTKKDDSSGTCTLFPNKLVKGEGWCRSWSFKANT